MKEPLVTSESGAPELPPKIRAAASFFFQGSESITFTSIRDRARPDFAGKQEYNFTIWSPKVGNTSVMSFLSLSEDAKGNIYFNEQFDRRGNPQYKYIPAEDVGSYITRYQAIEQAHKPQPEIPKVISLLDMPQEELDRLLGENTKPPTTSTNPKEKVTTTKEPEPKELVAAKKPTPQQQAIPTEEKSKLASPTKQQTEPKPAPAEATADKVASNKPADKNKDKPAIATPSTPKEVVRQYVSPLGKLHDFAKWACDEANAHYPDHAKPGRKNGHKLDYKEMVATIQLESGFDTKEKSSTGCVGLGQFCKATFESVVDQFHLKEKYPKINFDIKERGVVGKDARLDPAANLLATAYHNAENINMPRVGGNHTKAYIVHNLGEAEAGDFLKKLSSSPDEKIDPKIVAGVSSNKGLYGKPKLDKDGDVVRDKHGNTVYSGYKTYRQALDFIDDMLDRKGKSAERELSNSERQATEEAKSKKKVAEVDIGDDLRQHLVSNVQMVNKDYSHIPTSGPRTNQTQIT